MSLITVRSFTSGDAEGLAGVFYRSVQEGAARHYTAEQRAAWLPEKPKGEKWQRRLQAAECVVAERNGKPIGFMTLVADHIDLAFVDPSVMGQGVADAIYAVLRGRALVAGKTRLTVDASKSARSFFQRHGWRLVARQEIERAGVMLHNYRMETFLSREMAA